MRIDGEPLTARDVDTLRTIETSTGLAMTRPVALVAAMERRSQLSLARRAEFSPSADALLAELTRMRSESRDETALADAIRRAGEPAYVDWIVEGALAEKWLVGVWERSVVAEGERRVGSALKAARSTPERMKEIAAREGGDHLRFKLEPDSPVAHLPTGVRLSYDAEMLEYMRGQRDRRPTIPVNDFDSIEGFGHVPSGYVQEVASKVFAPLADGAVSPTFVHDGRDWYVMRRLSARGGAYDAEAIRFKRPEFADWVHTRRRDLDYQICSPGAVAEAAKAVPDHPLWEILR